MSPEHKEELKALNNYVEFTNESTHGLLIVHRLLENFNQTVNKYVDLESNQLNFYSNADLPKNIFEDPEHWFYDVSPYEWYDKTIADSKRLPRPTADQLNKHLAELKRIITRINKIRFELDDLTQQEDLQQRKNLASIYKKLEECVNLYNEYDVVKQGLKTALEKRYLTYNITTEEKPLGNIIAIHENIHAFLKGVRNEQKGDLQALAIHLKNNLLTAKSFKVPAISYQNALKKATTFTQVADKYLSNISIPSEYNLYGNTYYYYNVEMVAKFNRYGSGMVRDMNNWMAENNYLTLLLFEEPHFFKVIYPKREIAKIDKVGTIKPNKLPETMRERAVVIKQKQITVSPGTVTIEVYDHQLQDGDIISLNYNGHWILEEYMLRRKAKKMTLPLKPTNDNYLILHAVNLGNKPPNTVTLSYIYKGEKKTVVMESDMNESEMIKINIEE